MLRIIALRETKALEGYNYKTRTCIMSPQSPGNTEKNRIYDRDVSIDTQSVAEFFEKRASKYESLHPLATVIYQDNNPELAKARDDHEKMTLLPYINPELNDKVLDIGCGIGRWAHALYKDVHSYMGIDASDGLISIARKKFADCPNVNFKVADAATIKSEEISQNPEFNKVLISGLLIYLNDLDVHHLLSQVSKLASNHATIIIREPLAISNRLTLKEFWSEDLDQSYSAIYRTKEQLISIFSRTLLSGSFELKESKTLFGESLSNRRDTSQHFFVFES